MMGMAAAAVAALLLASAVLTAIHDAVFRISASHVRTLGDEGFDGAEALGLVRERSPSVRASVRVVTQALDLTALGVIAVTQVSTWGRLGPVPSIVIGGFVVLIVADLIPHLIAARRPVRFALSTAPILLAVERLARPLTAPVERLEDKIGGGDAATEEQRDLREIQEIGQAEGVLEERENQLVERAFRLDEIAAWDVMVPRVDIFAWPEDRTLADIIGEIPDVPYSRVPVYDGSVDDITGIVYVREAYARYAKGDREVRLKELARPPFFVPGSASCAHLLREFQVKRIHMGFVADEFGGVDGLVTLEDVLEELVGEIHDETDIEEVEISRVGEDSAICLAAVDLRDLESALDVTFPDSEHRSLNGFILEEFGHVPTRGETFEVDGIRIEVLTASDTQVVRARVSKIAGAE